MQSEDPAQTMPRAKHLGLLITGALLLVVGGMFLKEANLPRTERSWLGHRFELLLFASPLLLVMGVAMLVMGVSRLIRQFAKTGPTVSPRRAEWLEKAWRVFIWAVAGATIFPWWWLDILALLNGQRPGNEGAGMGGTLIAMFVGLPSLGLALFNEIRLSQSRNKRR